MRIHESTLLRGAFENSFGFMLNRLADAGMLKTDHFEWAIPARAAIEDACWMEFACALEDIGIELEDAEVVKAT